MRQWMVSAMTCTALLASSPLQAGVTELSSSVDDIVARQSAGLESAFFGHRIPGDPYGHVVTIQPFVGGYGSDGILSGVGFSWHTARLLPWDVGASVGFMDLDLKTWTVAVSSGTEVWRGSRSTLMLEGAAGYQFLSERQGDDVSIHLEDQRFPDAPGDQILLDSFDLFHFMVHAAYALDLWALHPSVDVAWVATTYRLEGAVWDGAFPIAPAEQRDDDGSTAKVTYGLGISLDIRRAVVFGGVRIVDDAAFFQANLGFRF